MNPWIIASRPYEGGTLALHVHRVTKKTSVTHEVMGEVRYPMWNNTIARLVAEMKKNSCFNTGS